ncbi:MAG: hypothetical protein N2205_08980, partial [Candidatus Caldatribacterium sp.]|nr:hypothetical protein [Candidatus Caldatribacterium sp.]
SSAASDVYKRQGLNLLGVQPYWQMIVKGVIVIFAVLLDRLKRRFRTAWEGGGREGLKPFLSVSID